MLEDKTDFVRQGAYIAMSMILIQNNNIKSKAVYIYITIFITFIDIYCFYYISSY